MNKKNNVMLFSWRHAIQESDLPSITKLVLFNLSIYMNDRGEGCFPSIEKQMEDTGLTNKTICKHIDIACKARFLCKNKHGYGGQKWARNEYRALMPLVEIEDDSQFNQSEGKKGSVPNTLPHPKGSVPSTPPYEKRQCTSFQKAVYEVHTNYPYNSPDIIKKNYIKKREDENCEDGFIFEDLKNSDQNELQGNLSKHSEIKHSFPETKGKSPKADKVIAKADKVMVSRDTKRIDDDLGNAGISQEVWEGYREMRKKMKKPLTDRAEQLAIKKAVSLSVKCRCTPDDIIDQSTMNGWLGFFELKTITTTYGVKQNEAIRQNTNPSPAQRGREANQRYLEELEQRAIESGYTNEMESEGRGYGC